MSFESRFTIITTDVGSVILTGAGRRRRGGEPAACCAWSCAASGALTINAQTI